MHDTIKQINEANMTIQQLEDQLEVCANAGDWDQHEEITEMINNAEYRMNDKDEVVLMTTINDQFYLID
jgi:hypothetical protein